MMVLTSSFLLLPPAWRMGFQYLCLSHRWPHELFNYFCFPTAGGTSEHLHTSSTRSQQVPVTLVTALLITTFVLISWPQLHLLLKIVESSVTITWLGPLCTTAWGTGVKPKQMASISWRDPLMVRRVLVGAQGGPMCATPTQRYNGR